MSTPALAFFALPACLYIGANQPPPTPAPPPSEPPPAPPAVEFVVRPEFVQSLPLDPALTVTRPPISLLEQPAPSQPEYAITVHSADVWLEGNVTRPHCIVVIPYDDRPSELSATVERLRLEQLKLFAEIEALRAARQDLITEVEALGGFNVEVRPLDGTARFRVVPQPRPRDEPTRDKGDDGQ